MSNDATHWAFKQRGLSPATKLVLWQLCDRHNPDNGCFPSQQNIAKDCEMSRASINTHLNKLEHAGLIRRIQGIDPITHRQRPTRYKLAFEADFALPNDAACGPAVSEKPKAAKPCPDSGHGDLFAKTTKAVSKKTQKPCPDLSESRVQILDTNLVREPLRKTLSVFGAKNSKVGFEAFWEIYPRPKNRAESQEAFEAAIAEGVNESWLIQAAKAYRLEQSGNPAMYVAQSDNWLEQKRWNEFPEHLQATGADLSGIDGTARLWAATIKRGGYVPSSAISANLAAHMVQTGLVMPDDLRRVGVHL